MENTNDDTSRTAEEILSEICVLSPPVRPSRPSLSHGTGIYWASADANKLFDASQDENAHSHIQDMIATLKNATILPLIWYNAIVEGHDADNMMSEYRKKA